MLCERFENFARETELVGKERVSAFNSRCDDFIQIATNSPGWLYSHYSALFSINYILYTDIYTVPCTFK